MKQMENRKKTKTARWFERIVPPGASVKPVKEVFWWGMAISVVYSMGFLIRYSDKRSDLFYTDVLGRTHMWENARMADFADLISGSLLCFYILSAVMLAFIAYNYMYYRRGSKSIYTMRRLPNRWEMHKRSITLPVLAALAMLAAAFVTLMIYFAVYMLLTPDKCLVSGQWAKLWRGML